MALSPDTYDYSKAYTRVVWHNYPSTQSPINETNLNKMDLGTDTVDDRIIQLNTVKAEKIDMLQALKSVTYNTQTGLFTFTWFNGTVLNVDLNIEKIPVSFSMSEQGVITMTTADGTTYTADVSSLIKIYTFNDSSEIDFTVTTDSSGNKTVTASIKAGSITGDKLQPNYLADVTTQAQNAAASASAANSSANDADYDAKLAQSYAVGGSGVRQGEDTDNAKYYCQQAQAAAQGGHVIQTIEGTTVVNMPQRANLAFTHVVASDDSVNNRTNITPLVNISDAEWTAIQNILNPSTP